MSTNIMSFVTHAICLSGAVLAVAAVGTGSLGSLDGRSQASELKPPNPVQCASPCSWYSQIQVPFSTWSLGCAAGSSPNPYYENVYQIVQYNCPNGSTYNCSQWPTGPCTTEDPIHSCP